MNTPMAPHSIIRASAGTGKTFELSSRYIKLLLNGVQPKSILATTFTRKAAGEILDRIVLRLAKAAESDENARNMAEELKMTDISREQFNEVLQSLVRNLNNLQVETLDAFFFKIARAFSLDICMPPGWEIADNAEMEAIRDRAIRHSLTRSNIVSIMHDLAKGEAKRGIHSMIQMTVKDLYAIYRETADTDRLQAWSKLQALKLLSEDDLEFLCQQIENLEYEAKDAFREKIAADLIKVREKKWSSLISSGPSGKLASGETVFNRFTIPPELQKLLLPIVKHASAMTINVLVKQTQGAYHFLQKFHDEFKSLKISEGNLEFNDVAYLTSLLFSRYSFERLAWRMDQKIDHLLLDEFQDTSIQQWRVLRPLAKRVCKPDTDRTFFCVGDVKQAIYGWRGGVAEIFDEVQNEFSEQIESPSNRSKSWRSSPAVIETVNQVFSQIDNCSALKEQKEMFQSWQSGFKPHTTERTELAGQVTFETTLDKKNHHAEVAARIQQISSEFPQHSIGVLVRTNKEVAKLIFELSSLGVHASEEGGNPLTDSAGVNLILSGLKLMDHPDDTIARFHVLNSPLAATFGLTKNNFQENDLPLRAVVQEMRMKLIGDGYGDLLSEWAKTIESHCTSREWFRVGQLIEKSYSFSAADHLRTSDLIQWVKTQKVSDPTSALINVMTFHKSKGLEFDIVILPDLDFDRGMEPRYVVGRNSPTEPIDLVCRYMNKTTRGQLPSEFNKAFDDQLQGSIHEMLCTIYVALTRAKHAMHMIVQPDQHAKRKTAAGLIMAALQIDHDPKKNPRQGEILWETHCGVWEPMPAPDPDEKVEAPTKIINSIPFAPSSTHRNLPWESPSGREGESTFSLGKMLQREDNQDARIYGSLIHKCFEYVEWLEDGLPEISFLTQQLQLVEGTTPSQVENAIKKFQQILKNPETAQLLSRQQYAADLFQSYDKLVIENERPFEVRLGQNIMNGFIDRLVLLIRDEKVIGADIVDFKTDSVPTDSPHDLQKRVNVYKPQIQSYRDAVAAIYGLSPDDISARLMFVAIDRQVPIG